MHSHNLFPPRLPLGPRQESGTHKRCSSRRRVSVAVASLHGPERDDRTSECWQEKRKKNRKCVEEGCFLCVFFFFFAETKEDVWTSAASRFFMDRLPQPVFSPVDVRACVPIRHVRLSAFFFLCLFFPLSLRMTL